MRRKFFAALAVGTVGLLALTACSGSSSGPAASGGSSKPKVGVILPDSSTSPRWENNDRPNLTAAFEAAGYDPIIENAQKDVTKFQTIADGMISSGVKALLITSLDSPSGSAVIKKATAAGVPVIDYDRLTLGGGAQYYVSYDNVAVGKDIGDGLIKCLQAAKHPTGNVIELNGSPDDNNATLFKQGYDKAIKAAGYKVIASQAVPGWDAATAGTLFAQLDTTSKGDFVGVASANDTLGGAVIARLKTEGLDGKVAVTGQDGSVAGLQQILLGNQCVTIYKSPRAEAAAAAKLAIDLIKGDKAAANAYAVDRATDSVLNRQVPSVILTADPITATNIEDVIKDGGATAAQICTTAALKTACAKYNVK